MIAPFYAECKGMVHLKIQENIAATLKAKMEENHETLAEFSQRLGIARSSLQEYLKENSNPRADTIELLADKLAMTPAELISGSVLDREYALKLQEKTEEIHPMLQPVAAEYLRLLQELFLLSDRLYALDTEGESGVC